MTTSHLVVEKDKMAAFAAVKMAAQESFLLLGACLVHSLTTKEPPSLS